LGKLLCFCTFLHSRMSLRYSAAVSSPELLMTPHLLFAHVCLHCAHGGRPNIPNNSLNWSAES
jgi:hypothetical protein